MNNRQTIVVNLFAGPGAGKTTCAWEIASELKKKGIETEYVSEYAKELVWDNRLDLLDGSLEHQKILYSEQLRRVQRLIGKVEVVVTDSPPLLSLMYLKEKAPEFERTVLSDFAKNRNFNLFINRSKEYQQTGRIQNAQESKEIDRKIIDFLDSNHIYYGTYYHKTVNVLIDNIIKNLKKEQGSTEQRNPQSVRQKLQSFKGISPEQQYPRDSNRIVGDFISE